MEEKDLQNILDTLFRVEEKYNGNKMLEMLIEGGREAAELRAVHRKLKAKREKIMKEWKDAPDEKAKENVLAKIATQDEDFAVSEQEINDARVV